MYACSSVHSSLDGVSSHRVLGPLGGAKPHDCILGHSGVSTNSSVGAIVRAVAADAFGAHPADRGAFDAAADLSAAFLKKVREIVDSVENAGLVRASPVDNPAGPIVRPRGL